jgi:hypothetical protein
MSSTHRNYSCTTPEPQSLPCPAEGIAGKESTTSKKDEREKEEGNLRHYESELGKLPISITSVLHTTYCLDQSIEPKNADLVRTLVRVFRFFRKASPVNAAGLIEVRQNRFEREMAGLVNSLYGATGLHR